MFLDWWHHRAIVRCNGCLHTHKIRSFPPFSSWTRGRPTFSTCTVDRVTRSDTHTLRYEEKMSRCSFSPSQTKILFHQRIFFRPSDQVTKKMSSNKRNRTLTTQGSDKRTTTKQKRKQKKKERNYISHFSARPRIKERTNNYHHLAHKKTQWGTVYPKLWRSTSTLKIGEGSRK